MQPKDLYVECSYGICAGDQNDMKAMLVGKQRPSWIPKGNSEIEQKINEAIQDQRGRAFFVVNNNFKSSSDFMVVPLDSDLAKSINVLGYSEVKCTLDDVADYIKTLSKNGKGKAVEALLNQLNNSELEWDESWVDAVIHNEPLWCQLELTGEDRSTGWVQMTPTEADFMKKVLNVDNWENTDIGQYSGRCRIAQEGLTEQQYRAVLENQEIGYDDYESVYEDFEAGKCMSDLN